MKLYKEIDNATETCSLGCVHQVGCYLEREFIPTGETFERDLGYGGEPAIGHIWMDVYSGERVREIPTVDYSYFEDGWHQRPDRYAYSVVRNQHGRLIPE